MIVGALGGGQLGRMLALAGHRLGVQVRCFDPDAEACAGQVTELVVGDYHDTAALGRLIAGCDAVTYEFENVPIEAAAWCAERVETHPAIAALAAAQDRMEEKALLRAHGLEPVPHMLVESELQLREAVETIGLPAVLKTCRGGYDGKGQVVLRKAADIPTAWAELSSAAGAQVRLVLEGFIAFSREISLLTVRGKDGQVRHYDPVCNEHEGGILVRSRPAGEAADPASLDRARAGVASLMAGLGYVGVLAVEFFETASGGEGGELVANEMA
ncbi:N5-carboxyaminoimidazole ribonucleotide synthase, partial [hydrothermal vent metagenome]